MSKYSSRSFNPAVSAYYNTMMLRRDMPKEQQEKETGGLLTKKTVNKTVNYENEPMYRVAKHMEAIEQFRKEKA